MYRLNYTPLNPPVGVPIVHLAMCLVFLGSRELKNLPPLRSLDVAHALSVQSCTGGVAGDTFE